MKYGSVCSGIEAATVAWHGINATMCMTCEGLGVYGGHPCAPCKGRGYVGGWEPAFFSEIEKFPCALLAHHYPGVPNLGDLTKNRSWKHDPIDLLVGGTPCQSFSVAGVRAGLDDPRGNLAIHFVALAARSGARWVLWENVPGVLSSSKGRDFAAIVGALAGRDLTPPSGGKEEEGQNWPSAGIIEPAGPDCYGVAWRVLDAQYFGVAQRRRRVFVVGYLGDWRPAAAVLFERASLQGNPAPRREKGQGFAADVEPSIGASGRGTARTGETRGQDPVIATFGGNNTAGSIDVATAVNAKVRRGRQDFESETFALHPRSVGRDNAGPKGKDWRDDGASFTMDTSGAGSVCAPVTGTLQANGKAAGSATQHDASEDGTGRGTPLVPVIGFNAGSQPIPINTMVATQHEALGEGTGLGIGQPGDPANTITKGHSHAVAQPIGFQSSQSGVREVDTHATLDANNGSRRHNGVMEGMAVRRLTPRECERLQGFPDDYTALKHHGKPAADGPRYKALGNSMAVPVMNWIGKRIQMVDDILKAGEK